MAIYQAFVGDTDNSVLNDLAALIDGAVVSNVSGTSVTFGNDPHLPGVTVTLSTGDGSITGTTPLASWHIQTITAQFEGFNVWQISNIIGVDGAPASGTFDPASIFQAETFRGAPRLIFANHDNTNFIIGGKGVEGLFGFGGNGTNDIVFAGNGTDRLGGDGGIDSLVGGPGHDTFFFNADPSTGTNLSKIFEFSATRDHIDLRNQVFDGLFGNPELPASEFHNNHAVGTHAQLVYFHKTGDLFYDPAGTLQPHELIAVISTDLFGHHHPILHSGNFEIIA
jgi:Ca2+-binding RTX toxin-like protein